MHPPIVQISLDLTDLGEALETARIAVAAGVDWLEAGTPLVQAEGGGRLSPLDELDTVVRAVSIPVQAVGGLTVEEAIDMPKRGAPLVVIGAPLAIAADSFNVAEGDLQALLAEITRRIRG